MDHSQTFPVVGAVPVPIAGPGTSQLLLPGAAGVGGESALPGIAGSGVYGSSLLRGAKDDGRIAAQRLCSGSQEGAPPASFDGSDGGVSQTRLSLNPLAHRRFPYLLKGVAIVRPNQVWSTDITYIRLRGGFVFLAAMMDWYSRYVLTWDLSISLEADFCVAILERALEDQRAEIFNTDQGVQFTSAQFQAPLLAAQVRVSMDGRGRAFDNIFVERLWRSVKYEEVYLKDYRTVSEARDGLSRYFSFYNGQRIHQSLDYRTPKSVHFATP